LRSEFGEGLREYLAEKKAADQIVSFGHWQVFDSASVYTCIVILSEDRNEQVEYTEISPDDFVQSTGIQFHNQKHPESGTTGYSTPLTLPLF